MQRAILTCDEGKKAGEDLKKRFATRNDDLEKRLAELQGLQKQFEAIPAADTAKRAELAGLIERKNKTLARDKDDLTADVQQAESELINAIGQKVLKVLDSHAKAQGYELILEISQQATVLWFPKAMDITEDVVAAVNKPAPAAKAASQAPPAKDQAGSAVARAPQK